MIYTLILLVIVGDGHPSITTAGGFQTEYACNYAGKQAVTTFDGFGRSTKYICVKDR